MLHVTNGGHAASVLAAAGMAGDILPWNDVLHEGPVRGALTLEARRRERAAFIAGIGLVADAADVEREFRARDDRLAQALASGEPVALWFEHDLYDQWQLVEVLARCAPAVHAGAAFIDLVLTNDYIGHLAPAEAQAAWSARTSATGAACALAERAWQALAGDDPRVVARLARELSHDTAATGAAIPHLPPALIRQLEEFPHVASGLSRTEAQLLQALAAAPGGALTLRALFPATHHAQEDPHFLGDTLFLAIVDRITRVPTPLLIVDARDALSGPHVARAGRAPLAALAREQPSLWNGEARLTDAGRRVLAGSLDHVRINHPARWLGGVALGPTHPDWRWDPVAGAVIVATA